MVDRLRSSERFWGVIPEIQRAALQAIDCTALPTTGGLCHFINWAIANRLRADLDADLIPFSRQTCPDVSSISHPTIAYVPSANIGTKSGLSPHSFFLVIGVEREPLLIDGANDQADPKTRFLVQKLQARTFDEIRAALRELRHPLDETRQRFERSIALRSLRILDLLINDGVINEDEYILAQSQWDLEISAGCDFLFLGFNRDWVTYFMRALCVDYPSTQSVQDRFYAYLRSDGLTLPQFPERDRQLAVLAKKLVEEL